jgi:hypothetical protein
MTPETYAKIVAKRPELAVSELLLGKMHWSKGAWRWSRTQTAIFDRAAVAMIESHWMRKMPDDQSLLTFAESFVVYSADTDTCGKEHDTPIDALAEFYGGGD